MEWAASQGDTTITQRYCTAQLNVYMSDEELVEFNRPLYTALAELCEGEALKITNTPNKLGLEAWRKLNKRYDPQTSGAKRSLRKSSI